MIPKQDAFKKRQKDTGWGYAVAHIIPFVFIYYSITRRTITPLMYAIIGNLLIGFSFGYIYKTLNPNYIEPRLKDYARTLGYVITPILAKKGIEKSRIYGKSKLNQDLN